MISRQDLGKACHNAKSRNVLLGPLTAPSVACLCPQCHMSNSRNDSVPCHYIFSPHLACHLALCRMSYLINAHVALSILGVRATFL